MPAALTSEATKKPACAGFFDVAERTGLLDAADRGSQAALVARSFVLVDQAAGAEAIQQRLGSRERGLGAGFVTGFDGLDDLLDGGAQHRAIAVVRKTVFLRRASAFFRGLDICHYVAPESGVQKGGALSAPAGLASIKALLDVVFSGNPAFMMMASDGCRR